MKYIRVVVVVGMLVALSQVWAQTPSAPEQELLKLENNWSEATLKGDAAALPRLDHACGLGTGSLFVEDVAEPLTPVDGFLPVIDVTPDPARLASLAASADRRDWWVERVRACRMLLA